MIQMKKKDEENMREFITRFDKLSNVASKHGITLSNTVLGLKIIHDSNISDTDKKLVMTEINFNKPDEIYTNAKGGLNKYLTTVGTKDATGQSPGIKLESNEEEILAAYRWNNKKNKSSLQKKVDAGQEKKRPLNPKGPKGEILRCKACDSFRHMINECPHSWENLEQNKSLVVNESDEESFFGKKVEARTSNENIEDIILYTQKKENVSALCEETLGCMILDSGCSRNVCDH